MEFVMKTLRGFFLILAVSLVLTGCIGQIMTPYPGAALPDNEPAAATLPVKQEPAAQALDREMALAGFQKGGCGGCHIIPGVPGATGVLGPDLSRMGEIAAERVQGIGYSGKAKTVEAYLMEALQEPDAFISPDCGGNPCQKGLMPASLVEVLSADELNAVMDYLAALPGLK
jgi:nitrite reductase (NO-forming) / hydroxylamine reductase